MTRGGPTGAAGPATRGAAAWLRRVPAYRLALTLVAALLFAVLISGSRGRFIEATAWEVPLVLELLLLTVAWRVVSARLVTTFFFIGFGPVFFGAVVAQYALAATPLQDWLKGLSGDFLLSGIGTLGNVNATIWAPITEELAKITPLLILLGWGRSRLGTVGGPLDLALLAGATGAGMGFAEDLFQLGLPSWTTPESPLLGLGVGTAYLALVVNPLGVFDVPVVDLSLTYQGLVSILDPSVEALGSGAVWAGHGVLPALFGLALGFAFLWRHRLGPLVYLLPIAAFSWAVWDHFVGNWYSAAQCERFSEWTLCGLAQLDGAGAALPIVAILAWVGASVVTRRAIQRHAAEDPATAVRGWAGSAAWYRQNRVLWPIAYALDVLRYWRLRSRFAFGWHHLGSTRVDRRPDLAARLVPVRVDLLEVAAHLRGEDFPEMPEVIRTRINEARSRA